MKANRLETLPKTSTHPPGASPFEPVFHSQQDGLPLAFARQFLSAGPVRLTGTMLHVWHLPLLHPLFWLMGKMGLLVPRSGENIPTNLDILPQTTSDDRFEQLWKRTLHFDVPLRFNSCVGFDADLGKVVENVGPGMALAMIWDIHLEKPDQMTWRTCGWKLMGLSFPTGLGRWLFGEVDFKQHVDENDRGQIHIAMQIRHPLFGRFFEYGGVFELVGMEIV